MHGNQGLSGVTDMMYLEHERFLFKSAIATIVDHMSRTLLSQHHMVRRFLEAFFLSRPPRRILTFIWSVTAVLDMLREWGPVRDLGRPKLAWKAIVLYAY